MPEFEAHIPCLVTSKRPATLQRAIQSPELNILSNESRQTATTPSNNTLWLLFYGNLKFWNGDPACAPQRSFNFSSRAVNAATSAALINKKTEDRNTWGSTRHTRCLTRLTSEQETEPTANKNKTERLSLVAHCHQTRDLVQVTRQATQAAAYLLSYLTPPNLLIFESDYIKEKNKTTQTKTPKQTKTKNPQPTNQHTQTRLQHKQKPHHSLY